MKKLASALILVMFLLSACQANMGLNVEGGLETNLLPGNGQQNNTQPQDQPAWGAEFFDNPLVIALIILLVILLVVFLFMRPRRGV